MQGGERETGGAWLSVGWQAGTPAADDQSFERGATFAGVLARTLRAAGYEPQRLQVGLKRGAHGALELHVIGDVPGMPLADFESLAQVTLHAVTLRRRLAGDEDLVLLVRLEPDVSGGQAVAPTEPHPALPALRARPSLLKPPALQTAPPVPASPPLQAPPAVQEAPAAQEAPALQTAPAVHEAPGVQEAPALQTGPAVQQRPPLQTAPAVHEAPGEQEAPALQTRAVLQQRPPLQTAPAVHEAPGVQEAPALQTRAVLQERPPQHTAPGVHEASAVQTAPALQAPAALQDAAAVQEAPALRRGRLGRWAADLPLARLSVGIVLGLLLGVLGLPRIELPQPTLGGAQQSPPARVAEFTAVEQAPTLSPRTTLVPAIRPTLVPTLEPTPTSAPVPSAVRYGAGVLFAERFITPLLDWPNNPQGNAWFDSGAYHLFAREPGRFVAVGVPLLEPFGDGAVSAQFHKIGGPSGGGYGFILRDQGRKGERDGLGQSGRYLVLEVGDRGEVGVWQREDTRWIDVLSWHRADAVRPGEGPNLLVAYTHGPAIRFEVNGDVVADLVYDGLPARGGVGIFVGGDLNEAALEWLRIEAS